MKPRTHYRSTSAEQLYACAGCGTPQPSRTMLLSSRGPVCGICAAEADAGPRAKSHLRDAGFDAVLLSSIANLGGIGLVLSASRRRGDRGTSSSSGCRPDPSARVRTRLSRSGGASQPAVHGAKCEVGGARASHSGRLSRHHGEKPRFGTERKGQAPMPMQRERDQAEIRQHVDKIIEGLRAKDLEGLKRLYATDVVSFDVEPPLQHVGVDAKLKNWASVFAFFQEINYEVRDLVLTVDETVAFGHGFGRLSGTLKNGAATSGIWVRATFCFRKIDGDWLIAHDQVSVPFDMASGKGVVDLEP
jgi:ketosteroid isomerase-like protein